QTTGFDVFPNWRFGTVRHWGEQPTGTWTLRVADRFPLGVGTWNGWSLRIYGTGTVSAPVGAPPQAVVTVSRAGAGTGTVTSIPGGINCPSDCSENYPVGTAIALAATAAPDSVFTGWSGACQGGGLCSGTLTGNVTVVANFAKRPPLDGFVVGFYANILGRIP